MDVALEKKKIYKVVLSALIWQLCFLLLAFSLGMVILRMNERLVRYDLATHFQDNLYLVKRVALAELINLIASLVILRTKKAKTVLEKKWWKLSLSVLFLTTIVVAGSILVFHKRDRALDLSWQQQGLVYHALGGIDKQSYTNSRDALEYHLQKGHKVYEVDLSFTTDGVLVCSHLWEALNQGSFSPENKPTLEQFQNTLICDAYQPLTFQELCKMMKKYPDIYVITDTKETSMEGVIPQFERFLQEVKDCECQEVLNRVIIQLYSMEMFDWVESVYHFDHYIFTLYEIGGPQNLETMRGFCRFAVSRGIDAITINKDFADWEWIDGLLRQYDMPYFWHTVNKKKQRISLLEKGATGVYTDFIE